MEADHQIATRRRALLLHLAGAPVTLRLLKRLAIALVLAAGCHVSAHPSHSSLAEIEWSERSLDIALKVIPEDIEQALSTLAGRSTVLVDTPPVRDLLTSYLSTQLSLVDGDSAVTSPEDLRFIGMQLDYRETWLYFSLMIDAPDADRDRYALRNTLLSDVQPGQVNRVKRLWAPRAPTLVFTAKEPTRLLSVSTP